MYIRFDRSQVNQIVYTKRPFCKLKGRPPKIPHHSWRKTDDLRRRLHSRRQAAKVFNIGISSAIRSVAQYLATGTVTPCKPGGNRRSKLEAHRSYLLRRVKEAHDISLAELTSELEGAGVRIHMSNVCRFLLAQGLTLKKLWSLPLLSTDR